jgi:hypothetical protein
LNSVELPPSDGKLVADAKEASDGEEDGDEEDDRIDWFEEMQDGHLFALPWISVAGFGFELPEFFEFVFGKSIDPCVKRHTVFDAARAFSPDDVAHVCDEQLSVIDLHRITPSSFGVL